ncbi:MAG: membrane protein [Cyclobacteriaceae bacterium]|nr:MAG: membrane protein [Cyclobacteriaceae bacterium]
MLESIYQGPQWLLYLIFGGIIFLFLVIDLGLLNRSAKVMSGKAALAQTLFWIAISLLFGILIYYYYQDTDPALAFFSAYATEKALSFDNMFVILLILNYFKIEKQYHHRILTWGILGALVFRGIFIFLGFYLIDLFHGILYIFAAFLIYSGIMLFIEKEDEQIEPEKSIVYRLARKFLPLKPGDHNGKFFVRKQGKIVFTSLFLVLLLIESSDLFFAADSIPAAFAISDNRFIIYTSNIFAVLGLRALFFLLASLISKFYLLQKGVALILVFIGGKLLLDMLGVEVPTYLSFSVIIFLLCSAALASIVIPQSAIKPEQQPLITPDAKIKSKENDRIRVN